MIVTSKATLIATVAGNVTGENTKIAGESSNYCSCYWLLAKNIIVTSKKNYAASDITGKKKYN